MSQEPQINSVTATNSLISPQIQNPTETSTLTSTINNNSDGAGSGLASAGPTVEIRTSGINRPGVTTTTTTTNSLAGRTMQIVKSQDVRVDNWGNYCLQRLQVMYDRGDFCDLILQFHNNQILKVHRVVVNLCTEYFANLERQFGLQDGMLVLPKDIEYSTMVTIVKFFYTGKLEVKGNQFNDIYRTVKLMNILILTKLLEAHARKPIALAKKEPSKPIVFKQAVEIGRPMQKIPVQQAIQQGATIKLSSPTGVTSKTIARSFPPGVKTKTVLARVQPQTIRVGNQILQGKLSTPKKLPIWKERKYAPVTNSDPLMMEKWPPKDEPPRPTRFEWPDPSETEEESYLTPASHALMEKQKAAGFSSRKAEDIFDSVKIQNQGVKRSLTTPTKGDSDIESPASKVPKVLVSQGSMETSSNSINISLVSADISAEESSISDVNLTDETVEEVVSTSESFSQDSVDASLVESVTSVDESSLLSNTSISFEQSSAEISTPSPGTSKRVTVLEHHQLSTPGSTPAKRSAMKSTAATPGQKVEKTVRFAPEVCSEKENKSKNVSSSSSSPVVISKGGDTAANNHSKIISEVLKKYPDLVKENRNIKLKIVQKDSTEPATSSAGTATTAVASASSKDPKSKVSYIVLKSTSAPDSGGSVVLKKPAGVANKAFWDSDKTKKPPSGAENTTGPWLCSQCGTEEVPIEFDSYYTYRRHLVDVHGERIDARICEYCGQKASKRNLLLYHLYTKHGVSPPKNCVFPHCDRCDYVALSESLLAKHKQGHDINKEFACTICNASFKSNSALQGHMAANLHRNKDTKVYECPYCRKPFVRNINLKAHIRSLHKDVARIEEMEDPRLPPDESLAGRGVTLVQQGVKKRQFPSILGAARVSGTVVSESVEELPQGMEGLVRSLVTADGQTIEILQGIDPNSLTMPVLVPSADGTNVTLDAQHAQVGTEFVTGVNSDGTPAVFIMDSSQNAVEVDVSGMGVGMTADGSMIFEGGDPNVGGEQFIVQDMQGNQFRKIAGIDETGKQVIFLQLQDENGQVTMAPAILDDSVGHFEEGHAEGTAQFNFEGGQAAFSVPNDHMYLDPQKCSVFVSSGGVTLPVTVSTDAVGSQAAQVLLQNLGASVPPGHVIEFHTAGDPAGQNVVVTTANLLNQVHQGQVQLHAVGQDHSQLLQGQATVDGMGQQELHIVLGDHHHQVGVVQQQQDVKQVVATQSHQDQQQQEQQMQEQQQQQQVLVGQVKMEAMNEVIQSTENHVQSEVEQDEQIVDADHVVSEIVKSSEAMALDETAMDEGTSVEEQNVQFVTEEEAAGVDEEVPDSVGQVEDPVDHVADSVDHVADSVDHVADSVDQVADSVDQVGSSMDQVADPDGSAAGEVPSASDQLVSSQMVPSGMPTTAQEAIITDASVPIDLNEPAQDTVDVSAPIETGVAGEEEASEPVVLNDPETEVPDTAAIVQEQPVLLEENQVPGETQEQVFQECMQMDQDEEAGETEQIEMQEVMEVDDAQQPEEEECPIGEVMIEEEVQEHEEEHVILEGQEEEQPVIQEEGDLEISETEAQTQIISTTEEVEAGQEVLTQTVVVEELSEQNAINEAETQELVVEDAVVDV